MRDGEKGEGEEEEVGGRRASESARSGEEKEMTRAAVRALARDEHRVIFVIGDGVYDVTKWAHAHPGGADVRAEEGMIRRVFWVPRDVLPLRRSCPPLLAKTPLSPFRKSAIQASPDAA